MEGQQGHPVPPSQGANPCKDTKCTAGMVVAPCSFLMSSQSLCTPSPGVFYPPPPPCWCPPCPGVPGTVGGLPAGWVPIRSRSRRSWWGDGQMGGGRGWIQSAGWGENKKQDRQMHDGGGGCQGALCAPQHPAPTPGGRWWGGVWGGAPSPLGLMEKIKKQKFRARGVLVSGACADAHGNGGEAAELLLEALPRPGDGSGAHVAA